MRRRVVIGGLVGLVLGGLLGYGVALTSGTMANLDGYSLVRASRHLMVGDAFDMTQLRRASAARGFRSGFDTGDDWREAFDFAGDWLGSGAVGEASVGLALMVWVGLTLSGGVIGVLSGARDPSRARDLKRRRQWAWAGALVGLLSGVVLISLAIVNASEDLDRLRARSAWLFRDAVFDLDRLNELSAERGLFAAYTGTDDDYLLGPSPDAEVFALEWLRAGELGRGQVMLTACIALGVIILGAVLGGLVAPSPGEGRRRASGSSA